MLKIIKEFKNAVEEYQKIENALNKNEEGESKYTRFEIKKSGGLEPKLYEFAKKIQQTTFMKFYDTHPGNKIVALYDKGILNLEGTSDKFNDKPTGEPTSMKMLYDLTDKDFTVLDKLMREDLLFYDKRADMSGDKKEKEYLKSLWAEEYQRAASLDDGQDL